MDPETYLIVTSFALILAVVLWRLLGNQPTKQGVPRRLPLFAFLAGPLFASVSWVAAGFLQSNGLASSGAPTLETLPQFLVVGFAIGAVSVFATAFPHRHRTLRH